MTNVAGQTGNERDAVRDGPVSQARNRFVLRRILRARTLLLVGLNAAGAVSLLGTMLLIKLGLRRTPDPWRRTLGLGLRSEGCKFALSAFGLRLAAEPPTGAPVSDREQEEQLAERLAGFLRNEPDAHFVLRQDRFCTCRVPSPQVDVTLARFSPSGELQSIRPFLDDRQALAPGESDRFEIEGDVIEEYNRTRHLPERTRARVLVPNLRRRWGGRENAPVRRQLRTSYGERIVRSVCLSFELAASESDKRFEPPDFRFRRVIGLGFLNFVCRRLPDGAVDLWMQVHHTGGDGVPMQELLTRLESAWGADDQTFYPADRGNLPEPVPCCASPQERPLHVITDFIDFAPLLALRKGLNQRSANEIAGNIPVGCLLLWCLAHRPEFAGVTFASTVDVPATDTQARAVDFVPIRPGAYMQTGLGGFVAFVDDFRRRTDQSRARQSAGYKAMRRLALLPPALASAALRMNPEAARSAFGSVGVSIVKEGKVGVGTMADAGFDGGFIVIGSMSLPCSGGGTTTSVSIKGEPAAIRRYPLAIRQAIKVSSAALGLEQGLGS
ncbi:MAG: hypothetical protein JO015_07175 [Verrucomicrobia bacterium]|nr:hypothetical protein [Verrucomicrobiota bacterium]